MVSGPGIESNSKQIAPAVVTLDLAPTFLDIAGLDWRSYGMDGVSLWPLLKGQSPITETGNGILLHDINVTKDKFMDRRFLVEYHGERGSGNEPVCRPFIGFIQNITCLLFSI